MRTRYYRSVAPAVDLLDLDAVKLNLRVDSNDENANIESLIVATQQFLEGSGKELDGYLGKAVINQTWILEADCPDRNGRLPIEFGPLQSVTSVQVMLNDAYTVWNAAEWRVSHRNGIPAIEPKPNYGWPSRDNREDAIKVTFVAGYGATPDEAPGPIIRAAHLMVAHLFRNREAVTMAANGTLTVLPLGFAALLSIFRRRPI